MNKYNAARAAGYSETTSKSHTKDLDARVAMPDVLDRAGLTDTFLAQKLTELICASKVVGYLHNYKKSDKGGTEKIAPDEVVSNEFIDVPDWSARAKGMELALKLKGQLRDKVEHDVKIAYTEMKRIIIETKPMDLNLGEEVPNNRIAEKVV